MMKTATLLNLLQLADPALPIGGYSHSAGLETYVQLGIVKDTDTAGAFIRQMLSKNLLYNDAAFVSLAYDAGMCGNTGELLKLDDLVTATKMPQEMRQASIKMGIRLMKVFQPLCASPAVQAYREAIHAQEAAGHYSIAFGLFAAAMEIGKADALSGFYYTTAAGLVTNAVKLVPLGQQSGQEILFGLQPLIGELVQQSLQPDPATLGLCCTGFDIRSMQHERLYSRLYMS